MPRSNSVAVKSTPKKEMSERTKARKVNEALRQMPDKYLECRSYRYHALKKVRMFYWQDGSGQGVCRVSVCSRCGKQRDDYYSKRGELVDRRYTDPPGDGLSGYGHLTTDKVMRELFARATDIAASEGDVIPAVRHLALAR
jgi:hypothetical protein